ncbi:hypothetical protein EDB80DRAFT_818696 [Ilyonectria destructans]|nr:hypothetical protein EDB80DRAFT_818696 [Ilyonectria destructans]
MNQAATTNRACEQCRKKKIRCDGAKPICALCKRVRVHLQQTDDKVAVSGIDSQCSNQQQPGVPTSESGDVITFMGISESTREESNQPHSDSRSAAADEEACYPGTPASFVREPSSQYEHTSPTDQEMVDYLTQALPDIWTQESISQLDPFANSIVAGETNFNFVSLDNTESRPAPNEVPLHQDQPSQSGNGQNQLDVLRTTSDRSESCLFDVPSDVVDDLLGLHRIDEDPHSSSSREEWICKEEQRRAWWAVWELDSFDSISSRRPFSIDKCRMYVYLPVSDEAWFSGTPIESARLNTDILQCWKSLRDSENRDERAWFLISNFIAVQALELCQQRHVPIKNMTEVETVVSCFSLLFHEICGGSTDRLLFDEQNYGKSNWVILTRSMIQGGHIATRMLSRRASKGQTLTGSTSFADSVYTSSGSVSPPAASSVTAAISAAIPNTSIEDYIQPATEAFRIYQSWPPEFIGFCPPPMVCIITGPAAIMLRFARHLRKVSNAGGDPPLPSIHEDILILILSKFARYWNIGLLLLDFVRAF